MRRLVFDNYQRCQPVPLRTSVSLQIPNRNKISDKKRDFPSCDIFPMKVCGFWTHSTCNHSQTRHIAVIIHSKTGPVPVDKRQDGIIINKKTPQAFGQSRGSPIDKENAKLYSEYTISLFSFNSGGIGFPKQKRSC